MRIDAHQHFWRYTPAMEWISDEMQALRRDFAPPELGRLLEANGIDGCITVQAEQSVTETRWLLGLAEQYGFIRGVVGWTDLCAPDIRYQLQQWKQYPLLKGFRHILQSEDPSFMLQPDFMRGIGSLAEFDFTYDVLVYPHHLSSVEKFVAAFPDQWFVIDHLAKPAIGKGELLPWENHMRKIAAQPNVYCKVSGLVTEADWQRWRQEDFIPYLDVVADAFGTERLIFGSDWPVSLLAAGYDQVLAIVRDYFPKEAHDAVFGNNAARFYRLK